MLLSTTHITAEDLKTVIIAGAFGYHARRESLFSIGLLPEIRDAKMLFVGNSSLAGAVMMLLNKKLADNVVRIARAAQVIELSQCENFEDIFIREMNFKISGGKS